MVRTWFGVISHTKRREGDRLSESKGSVHDVGSVKASWSGGQNSSLAIHVGWLVIGYQ